MARRRGGGKTYSSAGAARGDRDGLDGRAWLLAGGWGWAATDNAGLDTDEHGPERATDADADADPDAGSDDVAVDHIR